MGTNGNKEKVGKFQEQSEGVKLIEPEEPRKQSTKRSELQEVGELRMIGVTRKSRGTKGSWTAGNRRTKRPGERRGTREAKRTRRTRRGRGTRRKTGTR